MKTYFATPERAGEQELAAEIKAVDKSPVIAGLLHSISGLLAILDRHRQIIALNDSFLQMLGIDDPGQALGLRPGEVLQCVHAKDEPAGCGTTKFCSTCGAAIAIVSSLGQDIPVERVCALSAHRGDRKVDIAFLVRSQPIKIEQQKFILIFLQDITRQEQRAALERTFYHDINNMLMVVSQTSELLAAEDCSSKLTSIIQNATHRLIREVAVQRCLSENSISSFQPMWNEYNTQKIIEELVSFFENHPAANGRHIEFSEKLPLLTVKTDICLVLRVLCNMIINALEAVETGETVKVWVENKDDAIVFCVWNPQAIPRDIARRIFQRNFSTKNQAGRGIGTYSMKLFGEKILGGKVRFISSEKDGTTFQFFQYRLS